MKFKVKILRFMAFMMLIMILLSLNFFILKSQNLVNNGCNIVIGNGEYLYVSNDFKNLTTNNIDGAIDLNGKMIVKGDWINNAANNVFINIETVPNGEIILSSNKVQNILGINPTFFENLSLTNFDKILMNDNNQVNGILTLDAVLKLNSKKLILDNSSPDAINYKSSYILSETRPDEGYGEIQWNIADKIGTYQIPFGTGCEENDLNLTFTSVSKGEGKNGSVSFSTYSTDCDNEPLPTGVRTISKAVENIADRYWIINPDYSISNPDINLVFTYTDKDVFKGCNSGIVLSQLKAERYNQCTHAWNDRTPLGFSEPASKKVIVNGISSKDFFPVWRLSTSEDEISMFFPNAFSPNNDGINDIFAPLGMNLNTYIDFTIMIFDRWGKMIFETKDINKGWDGKVNNTAQIAMVGVYTYIVYYVDKYREATTFTGKVTLISNRNDK